MQYMEKWALRDGRKVTLRPICPENEGMILKFHGRNEAEFAMLVNDRAQHKGLGIKLLQGLCEIGQQENLERIDAEISQKNDAMQTICTRLGFKSSPRNNSSESYPGLARISTNHFSNPGKR
jgi:L-amino acid N-acyltransferase YncA